MAYYMQLWPNSYMGMEYAVIALQLWCVWVYNIQSWPNSHGSEKKCIVKSTVSHQEVDDENKEHGLVRPGPYVPRHLLILVVITYL